MANPYSVSAYCLGGDGVILMFSASFQCLFIIVRELIASLSLSLTHTHTLTAVLIVRLFVLKLKGRVSSGTRRSVV